MVQNYLLPIRALAVSKGLQIFSTSVMVTFSGLVGQELAPTPALSTLPMTIMLVSMGALTIPASFLTARLGSNSTFALGAVLGGAGAGLGALASWSGNFAAFCLGCALIGVYQASAQYYRYAAANAVEPDQRGRAVSTVLGGGILGAMLGPFISLWAQSWIAGTLFAGPFLALSALLVLCALVLFSIPHLPSLQEHQSHSYSRPIGLLLRDASLLQAITLSSGSYIVMAYVMTAAPLAIVACGHGPGVAAAGIQWHLVAMFAPSLMTGYLQDRLGFRRLASIGCLALGASLLLFAISSASASFLVGLILLGVGWNFLYFAGTMLIVGAIPQADQVKAQAANEFAAMASAAVVSGLAGFVFSQAGWMIVLVSGLVVVVGLTAVTSAALPVAHK